MDVDGTAFVVYFSRVTHALVTGIYLYYLYVLSLLFNLKKLFFYLYEEM